MSDGSTKKYFNCHRSGTYRSKGSGLRQLKPQGSCKTGKECLAFLEVTRTDGKVSIVYQKKHYEHSLELQHINLTDTEKEALAGQLVQGFQSTPCSTESSYHVDQSSPEFT